MRRKARNLDVVTRKLDQRLGRAASDEEVARENGYEAGPQHVGYMFKVHVDESEELAEETALFAQRLDLDVVKSMPNGFYCVEDWGCELDFSDVARGGVGRVVRPSISTSPE